MELDGEAEEEEQHGDRIPELAKDRKGEAKAVGGPQHWPHCPSVSIWRQ